jgi:hypothetical protein
MSKRGHGQIRRSQVVTTWGPGALIDLPRHSAIVGGLDSWPRPGTLDEIAETRLARKLENLTGVTAPKLYAPPPESDDPGETRGIGAWRFPEWFVVQEKSGPSQDRKMSRRLVHRKALDDKGRFEKLQVVATRFVRACPKGHVDDLDWRAFVHEPKDLCLGQLWLDEHGTTSDLSDLSVRCECGKSRNLLEATFRENNPLGDCNGARPWLGRGANELCGLPSRLLIRTASNAYFPQVVSALSLPSRRSAVDEVVEALREELEIVQEIDDLRIAKRRAKVVEALAPFSDEEVFEAIRRHREGDVGDRPVKLVELEALLAATEGFGEDVPVDPNFHVRRLPDHAWRRTERSTDIEAVLQIHRLREVLALAGFTRFEAVTPDINGDYETDVERAALAEEPRWFPAVENRGEGIFVHLRSAAVHEWLKREAVVRRLAHLKIGHELWKVKRKSKRMFPGGPYILLHTLSHLLIQSLSLRCGYPASSIRERVYADSLTGRYGVLLYTGTPDAEGTLGGLVQQARHLDAHLADALRLGALCSNDPICAQHAPGQSLEERWLHGAACHGCSLLAETSCEMRNDYLDRALVVPVPGLVDAAFFPAYL